MDLPTAVGLHYLTLIDGNGYEHKIPLEFCTSFQQFHNTIPELVFFRKSTADFIQARYVQQGLYNLYIDEGAQVATRVDPDRWPVFKAGTKIVMKFLEPLCESFGDLSKLLTKTSENPVGQGGFGDVWKCSLSYTSSITLDLKMIDVAVKVLKISLDSEDMKDIRREVGIWKQLRHNHIVPFIGVADSFEPSRISLVSTWQENGTLTSFLKRNSGMMYKDRLLLLHDIASGLSYLHLINVVHGNLSGSNVLVGADGCARLTDFALSSAVNTSENLSYLALDTMRPGDIRWVAPELCTEDVSPTFMVDIYSYGCIMLQTLSGCLPWSEIKQNPVFRIVVKLSQGCLPQRPESLPILDAHWDFIVRCLNSSMASRPPATEVLEWIRAEIPEQEKSILDCDATRQPKNPVIPRTFFEDVRDSVQAFPILPGPVRETRDRVVEDHSSLSDAISISENQPILKPKSGLVSESSHLHDTQLCIDLYPTTDLEFVVDDIDDTLQHLTKYMEGDNFNLREIGNLLSSTDLPRLLCAGLQLLEHAAKWQKINFGECVSATFGPVANLVVDFRDSEEVHCAALDTLRLFLELPHAIDIVKTMMPRGVVDAVSNDLSSPEPHVQLASVELLEVAARSGELLNKFAAPISRIPGALPFMPTTTQVTALRVIELIAGSNEREVIKALAANFHYLKESLSSPEDTVQTATLKVLEASMRTKDPDLFRAVQTLSPDVKKILSWDEADLHSVSTPLDVPITTSRRFAHSIMDPGSESEEESPEEEFPPSSPCSDFDHRPFFVNRGPNTLSTLQPFETKKVPYLRSREAKTDVTGGKSETPSQKTESFQKESENRNG